MTEVRLGGAPTAVDGAGTMAPTVPSARRS